MIAKLVIARPLGCLVLAMPYRHRQTVEHVSVPPAVLSHARQARARFWIVRLDLTGECYGLPLAEVERAGWLTKPADGPTPEWYVKLSRFRPVAWQDWDYVTDQVDLTARSGTVRQTSLFDLPGVSP